MNADSVVLNVVLDDLGDAPIVDAILSVYVYIKKIEYLFSLLGHLLLGRMSGTEVVGIVTHRSRGHTVRCRLFLYRLRKPLLRGLLDLQ